LIVTPKLYVHDIGRPDTNRNKKMYSYRLGSLNLGDTLASRNSALLSSSGCEEVRFVFQRFWPSVRSPTGMKEGVHIAFSSQHTAFQQHELRRDGRVKPNRFRKLLLLEGRIGILRVCLANPVMPSVVLTGMGQIRGLMVPDTHGLKWRPLRLGSIPRLS
jgi:hypothetical protein